VPLAAEAQRAGEPPAYPTSLRDKEHWVGLPLHYLFGAILLGAAD
jgi:hypothetical protein